MKIYGVFKWCDNVTEWKSEGNGPWSSIWVQTDNHGCYGFTLSWEQEGVPLYDFS